MNMDTFRDDDDGEEGPSDAYRSDAYWRRRALTLALGLGLVAVLVWVFTGSGGGRPPIPVPTGSQQASLQPEAAYSAVPTAPPATQGSLKTPAATRTAGTRPSPSAGASGGSGGGSGGKDARGGRDGGSGSGSGGNCSPGAIVLSLFSNKSSYAGGEDPRFEVYVVSTAPAACTFDLGPAKLQVQVMSAGRIVWDSADCARGGGTRVATLRRGVPSQESVTWNRAITLPGCDTLSSSVRPGTYQVQAKAGTVASAVLVIKLAR
jgi:hypothetical protein